MLEMKAVLGSDSLHLGILSITRHCAIRSLLRLLLLVARILVIPLVIRLICLIISPFATGYR
jgi:hypothetical protein